MRTTIRRNLGIISFFHGPDALAERPGARGGFRNVAVVVAAGHAINSISSPNCVA